MQPTGPVQPVVSDTDMKWRHDRPIQPANDHLLERIPFVPRVDRAGRAEGQRRRDGGPVVDYGVIMHFDHPLMG